MQKRLLLTSVLLSLILLSVFFLSSCSSFAVDDMKYIIHGGGNIDGHNLYGEEKVFPCSNSREGLEQCVSAGCKYIEIDFNFTSDGYLVCLHDWYHMYADEIETGTALSLDEFLDCKIFREFDSIWIEDIAAFLRENKDTYIITDIKDRNIEGLKIIADTCQDLMNRFIVQIYSEDEFKEASSLGFQHILYTLYRLDWNGKHDYDGLKKFVTENKVSGIVFSYDLCEDEGYIDEMLSLGIPLFVHTVDDASVMKSLLDKGITGIYTNTLIH